MADLNYSVGIDTRNAQRSLDGLKSQIAGFGSAIAGAFAVGAITATGSRFEDLRTTLQLLFRDTAVGAAAFDDIKKFAASSIFSVEQLTETIVKLKAAGIEPTVAQLKLFADVSSVAADSVGALQAVTDLYARTTAGGLGLEDLNRLADRGIPVFTILSERLGLSRLEISKVGQTAEGARVILKALEDGLQDAFGGASAARANNVSQAMSNLGDAVDNAADIIGTSGLNAALSSLVRNFTDIVSAGAPLFKLLGELLGGALQLLADNLKIAGALAAAFIASLAVSRIAAIIVGIGSLTKAFNLFNIVAGKNPLVKILSIAAAAAAAFGVLTLETEDLTTEIDKVNAEGEKLGNNNGFKVLKDGTLGAGTEDLRSKVAGLNAEFNKFRVEMDAVVNQFARYNDQTVQALNLETQLIGVAKELADVRRAEAEISRSAADEIARLTETKAKLTEEERKQGRGEIIDATIAKIKEQAEVDKAASAEAIKNLEARQRLRQVELFSIKSQIELQNNLQSIQDDIAKMSMNEIEKKYYDIERAAQASARAAIQAEEARIGRPLDVTEQRRFYEEASRGAEELKAKNKELYEQSRTFSTGWSGALREYADNATNAAKQAEQIFAKATQGMEDAIISFAKTGKFEFKSFVNSMLEDLLRSQVRQLMAGLFTGGGSRGGTGGGGLLGGSIIPGFLASGGPVSSRRPYIVGEQGPELFMPGMSGSMIPNRDITGGTNVTYNINAVDAASFKALVAADPAFIHAVASQGGKSIPARR
jgi:lambda family phage tail tape measure protein